MLHRRVAIITAAIITVASAIALTQLSPLSTQVFAQQNLINAPRRERGKSGLLRDLNLTPQQMQRINEIRTSSQQNGIREKRQQMRQAQQELQQSMAGNASQDQIRNKYNQLRTLKQQVADAQFENTLAIREVLTPQQRQQFAERMQNRRGNFRNRGQNSPEQ